MPLISGQFRAVLDALRGSFWLIPALMVLASIALSVVTTSLDRWFQPDPSQPWGRWMTTAGVDGARAVLTTVAGSMITLASLTYSLTLVALTLAAGQYGPRLLRTFMRDRVTQVGLGVFLSTFQFCLATLRAVGSHDDTGTVPHVSVATAMVLAIICLAFLVYFVHHVAHSINATSVIAAVSSELMRAIEHPPDEETDDLRDRRVFEPDENATAITSTASGYVTVVEVGELVDVATGCDGRLWVSVRPGDFVTEGDLLAYASHGWSAPHGKVRSAIVLGPERTMIQDTEFGIAQLVEVALRALSPGINDPFTAVACVDRLGAALVALAGHALPKQHYADDAGTTRVIRVRLPSFDGWLRAAVDPLRQAARQHVAVLVRLASMLRRVAEAARREEQRAAIARQLDMIEASARQSVPEPQDRDDVVAEVNEARQMLRRL